MLSGKCSVKDRLARINAWHQVYSQDEGGHSPPTTDECMEDQDQDESRMMEEAKRWSGVDDKVVAVVKSIKLFQDAPSRALAQVVSKLRVQEFEKGETIIEEGTEGSSMYIIDEGEADVMVKNVKVSEMTSHSFFGEVALVNSRIRTATVVATKNCRCLRLEQNDLWTVFNMFPSMYKTLAQVADARVHNAASNAEELHHKVKGAGNLKRRNSTSELWNVKFRAPLKASTPEQAGVVPSHCLYVNVQTMHATFSTVGDKSDKTSITLSDSTKVLHRSGEVKGINPKWNDVLNSLQLPYDTTSKLHFAVSRSSGRWNRKDLPVMTGYVKVLEVFQKQHQSKEAATITTIELSDADSKSRKAAGAPEAKGVLKVVLEISPPFLQPYVLWVPLQKMFISHSGFAVIGGVPALGHSSVTRSGSGNEVHRLPSDASTAESVNGGSASATSKVLPILDRSGKSIMWARWRAVPKEDCGGLESEDTVIHNKYVTVIDLATADGSYGGQIVTDVTAGAHARSRLLTSCDVHWATVKTKMVMKHHKHTHLGKVKAPASLSPDSPKTGKSDPHATYRSSYKVVPIYNEFEIHTSGPPAASSHSHSHSHLSSLSHQQDAMASRSVVLSRTKKDGQRITVGTCKIAHNNAATTHLRVDVHPQQDMIMLLQLALALGESQMHAPVPEHQPLPDSFQKAYQTS